MSFPIQVAAVKIFSQSRAPQCLPRILLDKLVKGFLALFFGRKKVRRSRAPRGRNWVRTRAHGRRELSWGLRWHNMGSGFFSLLLRSRSGASWSAPLVHPLTQWLGAAAGADCAWLPVHHGGFWKNFLFYVPFAALFAPGNLDIAFALVSFSPSVFGCCLWSTFLGRVLGSTVDTCFTSGFWRISHIFYVWCTQIVAFLSIPQNGEVCTVDASSCSISSRGSHFESGHYFYELSM